MKTISLEDLDVGELQKCSQWFRGMNYQVCDKTLSFVMKDEDGMFCGFALLRENNIDFSCNTSEEMDIDEQMKGCEILQIYGITPQYEMKICKRMYNRIYIWCYRDTPKTMFDYFWSSSFYDQSDYYKDLLNCDKVKIQYSLSDLRTLIYSKIRD